MTRNILINCIAIAFFALGINANLYAQLDSCISDISPKALKLFEKGTNKKKYKKPERMKFLIDAIDEEEGFVDAHFALAQERIKTARYEGTSIQAALENLETIVRVCPSYHSVVYFNLWEIFIGRMDYCLAEQYGNSFLDYESEDERRFSRKYLEQYEQVKETIDYLNFFCFQFNNPVDFNPKIVNNVSTKADEYLPFLSADNEQIYFTRKSIVEQKVANSFIKSDIPDFIEQLSSGDNDGNNSFSSGVPLPEPFNTDKNVYYGGMTMNIDNKHMVLTICANISTPSGPRRNCDLYTSHYTYGYNELTGLEDWHWTPAKNMGDKINTRDGWESQPTLSGDGRTLYFASAREGSAGIDIYYSKKMSNGLWGGAQNLGPPINTEKNDKTPFVHSDSKTLYYASQGGMNFGGYDMFYSRMDENGNWQEPINIGYPINTENDEHGFIVSTNGKHVYYASDNLDNKFNGLDVFTFDLYKEARPSNIALLKGVALNNVGNPVSKGTLRIKGLHTQEAQEIAIDSLDGGYAAIVSIEEEDEFIVEVEGEDIAFNAQKVSFAPIEKKKIDGVEVTASESIVRKLEITTHKVEVGETYKLENIYYGTNSAEMESETEIMLNEFADYLHRHPEIKIEIRGHTDNIGDANANLALSADRSYTVMQYLQSKGISGKRLSFKGFGETKPVATNSNEEGRSQNRRTEFRVVSK